MTNYAIGDPVVIAPASEGFTVSEISGDSITITSIYPPSRSFVFASAALRYSGLVSNNGSGIRVENSGAVTPVLAPTDGTVQIINPATTGVVARTICPVNQTIRLTNLTGADIPLNDFHVDHSTVDSIPGTIAYTDTAWPGHDAHQVRAPKGNGIFLYAIASDSDADTTVITGWTGGVFDSMKWDNYNQVPLDSAPNAVSGNFIGVWDSIYSVHIIHKDTVGDSALTRIVLQNWGDEGSGSGTGCLMAWPRSFAPLSYWLLSGGTNANPASAIYGKYSPYFVFDINSTQKYCWIILPVEDAGFTYPVDFLYSSIK